MCAPVTVWSQTGEATAADEDPSPDPQPDPPTAPPALVPALPSDPIDRLEMASAAFRRADYALLVPLLEPVCVEPSPLALVDDRVRARELLVVGHFFLAQQVTSVADHDDLLGKARRVSLDLLREKPDHLLDSLVFPVSVVDLFEDVRRQNAPELEKLLAARQSNGADGDAQTVYLERAVTKNPAWINLLPFGAGQFQNGHLVKGTIFAALQTTGLIVNATSYWMILRLRNPDNGRFSPEGGLSSDLARARRWRQVLYTGIGGFATVWLISILDGWLNHQTETVRVRTLDAPPPELGGAAGDAGVGFGLHLGLTLEFRW